MDLTLWGTTFGDLRAFGEFSPGRLGFYPRVKKGFSPWGINLGLSFPTFLLWGFPTFPPTFFLGALPLGCQGGVPPQGGPFFFFFFGPNFSLFGQGFFPLNFLLPLPTPNGVLVGGSSLGRVGPGQTLYIFGLGFLGPFFPPRRVCFYLPLRVFTRVGPLFWPPPRGATQWVGFPPFDSPPFSFWGPLYRGDILGVAPRFFLFLWPPFFFCGHA